VDYFWAYRASQAKGEQPPANLDVSANARLSMLGNLKPACRRCLAAFRATAFAL
jgi:hypothetical protein